MGMADNTDNADYAGDAAEQEERVEQKELPLTPEVLVSAYVQGIFPMDVDGQIEWFSPDPRAVIPLEAFHASKTLMQTVRQGRFEIRINSAFEAVMQGCAADRPKRGCVVDRPKDVGDVMRDCAADRPKRGCVVDRPKAEGESGGPGSGTIVGGEGEAEDAEDAEAEGTWISQAIIDAYVRLHELGLAHSVESWAHGQLVGGLYGVALGGAFFGESMFSRQRDASKVALVALVERLRSRGFVLLDVQFWTAHLARFGAIEIPRANYLRQLNTALRVKTSFVD